MVKQLWVHNYLPKVTVASGIQTEPVREMDWIGSSPVVASVWATYTANSLFSGRSCRCTVQGAAVFWDNKFDHAMVAFLDCVQQFKKKLARHVLPSLQVSIPQCSMNLK